MPASRKIRGYEGRVYTTLGAGTQTLLAHLTNYELTITADRIDASDHDAEGYKDFMSGLKTVDLTVQALKYANEANQADLRGAMVDGDDILVELRPIDAVGEESISGTFVVLSWKEAAPNSGAQAVDLQLAGRGALNFGTVASGA